MRKRNQAVQAALLAGTLAIVAAPRAEAAPQVVAAVSTAAAYIYIINEAMEFGRFLGDSAYTIFHEKPEA